MADPRTTCPRCGESLPSTLDVCDACGYELGAHASRAVSPVATRPAPGPRPAAREGRVRPGPTPRKDAIPSIAWLLLVVGLAVGGMVGYALHSAVGPRAEEGGAPQGPADLMAGAGGGGGGSAAGGMGGMGGGAPGGSPQNMPGPVMQMVAGYKATLMKNPKDAEALIGLGNLEFDSGQWQHAIDYYSRALEVDAKNADVRVDRAIAYHSSGQDDVAKKELLRVTREKPEHKNAWLNLGVVNNQLGDRAGALAAWEHYLQLDPQGEHAATVKQEIEALKQAG